MASNLRAPAKISPPKLSGILPRKRLFNLLDEGREKPIVWVSGQPGAGKTALIASYLESKKLANAWFHVDAGDADPASFFLFLRRIAARYSRSKKLDSLLPLLTPEYLPDLAGFSRRWFRQFFDFLPAKFILVFDNYQEVGPDAPIHMLLRDAVEELPNDVNVVVISRVEPPEAYARLTANRKLAALDWSDLQFTLDETEKMVFEDLTLNDTQIKTLHEETQGWAAGVTLLLERLRRTGKVNRIDRGDSMETVFNYFADLIFKQTTSDEQNALLRLSLLPAMTASQAVELTEFPDAGKLLEGLFRRRMFTDRRTGLEFTYHFHPLYRAFLASRAEGSLGRDQLQQTKRNAGKILEQVGQIESAFALYVSATDWESSVKCVLNNALALIQQGRWQTLESWFGALPEPVREITPWLTYWQGVCKLAIDPKHSRILFEQAYENFQVIDDDIGKVLAASGAANSIFYGYISFETAAKWIPILEKQIVDRNEWPSQEIEFQVLASFFILLGYHQPRHPLYTACLTRLSALMIENVDAGLKVAVGMFMLHSYSWDGDKVLSQRLIRLVQPYVLSSKVSPLFEAWWNIALCCNGLLCGSPDLALTAARKALEIVDRTNLGAVRDKVLLYYYYACLVNGELETAERLAQALEKSLGPDHPMEQGMLACFKSWQALLNDNMPAAISNADESIALCKKIGVPNFQMHALISKALGLNKMGQFHSAMSCIREIRENVNGTKSPLFDFTLLLIETEATAGLNDKGASETLLANAFDVGAKFDQMGSAQWIAPMMSRLCARALSAGIQPEYTTRLIRQRKLLAPNPALESWPWPVKVFTLGHFELSINGVAYAPARKAQRKVLELLKVLVALGGLGIGTSKLLETLWPDLDGDSAQNNLKGCIHRLRRLLESDDALIVQEGNISINSNCVWSDAPVFEAIADRILESDYDTQNLSENHSDAHQLLQQYRGHFFPEESEIGCILVTRDRLANKFRRAVLRIGQSLESIDAFAEATAIYQRAIDLDNLSEDIYQRLIFCLKKLGKDAEALNVFRRCRDMLSIILGVTPSRETRALVHLDN